VAVNRCHGTDAGRAGSNGDTAKEEDMPRSTLTLLALLALAACETAGGFGEDVEETGELIQEGAEEVEEGL
jgi:predicted small secreted protein